MGRTAAKIESLESIISSLAERLNSSGASSIGPYCKPSSVAAPHEPSSIQDGSRLLGSGQIIGQVAQGLPQLARDIDASRLKFPQDAPAFDPTTVFSEPHRNLYADPSDFKIKHEPDAVRPPHVRIRATRSGTLEFLRFLDKHKRLKFVPADEVDSTELYGAFSLLKDEAKDRLILDARPPNLNEKAFNAFTKTLGSITPLLQIELLPEETLSFSGDDLRDYYYGFVVSTARARRNCMNFEVKPSETREFSCYDPQFESHDALVPALATMAMGDLNAVELGQGSHVLLGLQSGAFEPEELLLIHGRAPRGSLAIGVIIDDFIVIRKLLRERFETLETAEGERRMSLMNQRYKDVGLLAHSGKAFRKQDTATFWGHSFSGRSGLIRASPTRLIPLMEVTGQIARLGVATVGLLEVLAGCWISVLQVRRRMFSLLEDIYAAQRGRQRVDIIRLDPNLVSELWTLVPLAGANLRAMTRAEVHLTDASKWGTAHVTSKLPLPIARELHRHCLAKGLWSKLLSESLAQLAS